MQHLHLSGLDALKWLLYYLVIVFLLKLASILAKDTWLGNALSFWV